LRCLSGIMYYNNHRKSRVTGSLWLGIALFFLVFCSCPVKKYIRLQLYKQIPLTESASGDRYVTHDIKDCSYAERCDQAGTTIFSLFHIPDNSGGFAGFFFPSLLSLIAFFFIKRNGLSYVLPRHRKRKLVPIPLYLRVRHLQV